MAFASHASKGTYARLLRKRAGKWLKTLREDQKLTQNQLAKAVGAEYFTFISQIENGFSRVPPEKYRMYADALGVQCHEFVKRLLSYYDPYTYDGLFTNVKPRRKGEQQMDLLIDGLTLEQIAEQDMGSSEDDEEET